MPEICAEPSCGASAHFRCSKCKKVFYCTQIHQKLHWKVHKKECHSEDKDLKQENPEETSSASATVTQNGQTSNGSSIEQRSCRCMFCGDALVLSSEEEAVDHMRICPALQEQLQSKDQFTVPKAIQEKMKK